jgi:hypothetical protein
METVFEISELAVESLEFLNEFLFEKKNNT